jgi:hypothetical protein
MPVAARPSVRTALVSLLAVTLAATALAQYPWQWRPRRVPPRFATPEDFDGG